MSFNTLIDLQDEYIARRLRIESMPSRGIKYARRRSAAVWYARKALLKRGYGKEAVKLIIRDAEDMVQLELVSDGEK